MARIDIGDLGNLIDDLTVLENLPETIIEKMLTAEAEVVIRSQQKKIEQLGLVDTGQLQKSIVKTGKLKIDGVTKYVDIYPKGTREAKKETAKEKQRRASRKKYRGAGIPRMSARGKKGPQGNNDVAFVHEYGAPHKHIPAKNWMEKANEESEAEAAKKAEKVYEDFLKTNRL